LITFNAENTAAESSAKDGRANTNGAEPVYANPSAIPNVKITEYTDYIRFDTNRRLAPGTANAFKITKGTTHDMAWAQYADGDFDGNAETGPCTLKLPGEDDGSTGGDTGPTDPTGGDTGTPGCPVSKRDSTTDLKRQQDCSPGITTKCYDAAAGLYKNSKCSQWPGSACGQWVQRIGGSEYYANGCILVQYCGTTGDYKDNRTRYRCPDKTTIVPPVVDPVGPGTDPTPGRQGTKCTLA
jgi:hypothetical protein